jgi:hypothetical protein
MIEGALTDETPLMVPALRPGVGEENKNPIKAANGKRCEEKTSIAAVNPDVATGQVRVESAEQLGDTIGKKLGTDKTDVTTKPGLVFRLPGEMFASTEANFKPNLLYTGPEEGLRI